MIKLTPPRNLSKDEKFLLLHLLSVSFPGCKELQQQIEKTQVLYECENCSTIELVVDSSAAKAQVKRRIPVEGESIDEDGIKIHFLIHVINGYLSEVEIFREDSARIQKKPEISSIKTMSLDSKENSW